MLDRECHETPRPRDSTSEPACQQRVTRRGQASNWIVRVDGLRANWHGTARRSVTMVHLCQFRCLSRGEKRLADCFGRRVALRPLTTVRGCSRPPYRDQDDVVPCSRTQGGMSWQELRADQQWVRMISVILTTMDVTSAWECHAPSRERFATHTPCQSRFAMQLSHTVLLMSIVDVDVCLRGRSFETR